LVDLGASAGFSNAAADDINNSGEIVGHEYGENGSQAFYYYRQRHRAITTPPGFENEDYHISDSGEIVGGPRGRWNLEDGGTHSLIGSKAGLTPFVLPAPAVAAVATAVNAVGAVTGEYASKTAPPQAFVTSGGKLRVLPSQSSRLEFITRSINRSGDVAGNVLSSYPRSTAFVYSRGKISYLPGLPGRRDTVATAISADGDIAGFAASGDHGNYRAFLYHGGHMIDLGTVPGFEISMAAAINSSAVVVGEVRKSIGTREHAAIFSGHHAVDLNGLVRMPAGVELTRANSINDNGQVVGYGLSHERMFAFLLTPKVR
jgi:probable HAF family extracellular repeat protein